jgi:hypothetical protein
VKSCQAAKKLSPFFREHLCSALIINKNFDGFLKYLTGEWSMVNGEWRHLYLAVLCGLWIRTIPFCRKRPSKMPRLHPVKVQGMKQLCVIT